ncbi:MAG TPA: polysaccharide deacetylase family protein [Desulfobacterales bacterium]|nr:polysaccharide deacetylase family protein [Desulfobacterales bacterium]
MGTTKASLYWLVSTMLVLLGYRRRAVKKLQQEGFVTVFKCHNTRGHVLKKFILWAKRHGFTFISQQDVLDFIDGKTEQFPPGSVWLTFDDGWKENTTEVFPVLQELRVPGTVFLATRSVERGFFWFDITKHPANAPFRQIGRFEYEKQSNAIREKLISELVQNPKVTVPHNAMSEADVKRWKDCPYIFFENHTNNHVVMSKCTDDEIKEEIRQASQKIEKWTSKKSRILCYPIGYFDKNKVSLLEECLISIALTTVENRWTPTKSLPDRYFIPRMAFPDYGPTTMAINSLCAVSIENVGVFKFVKRLLKR